MPRPFGQAVFDIHHPQPIEDVTARLKGLGHIRRDAEIEQGREGEPHAAALVGDRGAAEGAAYLGRQAAAEFVARGVVEAEMVEAPGDLDVVLLEDRRPLHRGAVQFLASPAMADLGVRGIGRDRIGDLAAMAARPVFGREGLTGPRGE